MTCKHLFNDYFNSEMSLICLKLSACVACGIGLSGRFGVWTGSSIQSKSEMSSSLNSALGQKMQPTTSAWWSFHPIINSLTAIKYFFPVQTVDFYIAQWDYLSTVYVSFLKHAYKKLTDKSETTSVHYLIHQDVEQQNCLWFFSNSLF